MNEWTDAETRVERARELYDRGRWAEAAAELRAAIEVNPNNADWHFNLGLTLDAMEDYARATEAYRQAAGLDPNDVETLNCLGMDMTRLGFFAESLECFERIDRIKSGYEPSYCNRIITYTEIGEHDKAELMFYLARQIKDSCPLCYYNIGGSFYARGMHDRAIDCWRQTLLLDPEHPQTNARIAEAYWAKGDASLARRHYAAELAISPGDVDTLLDFGELLAEIRQYEEAAEKFRRVLEQEPDHAAAHYNLGELALKQGKFAAAEKRFRMVLQIDRNYPGSHAQMGRLLLRRKQPRQAVRHLLAELKRCGDDPDMLQAIGQMLIEARQTRRANQVLSRLVTLSPDDPHAHHNLAVSHFMLGRLQDGISHCRKALKLKPDYALAFYNLALAHLQEGSIRRARRYAAKAMMLSPRDEHIRSLSGRLGLGGFWARLRLKLRR